MDTHALNTLHLVVQTGSFAAAARVQDVDPSTVSRVIAGLENELGVRLFQRSTRRLAMTEAGQLFLERAVSALEALEDARDLAAGLSQEPAGRVRLTASVAFGHELLLPVLPKLRAQLPQISLELILSDEPVDLIGSGIDMAIRLAPAPSGDLISARLMRTRYHVVASDAYDASAIRAPADLEACDVLRQPLAGFQSAWRFRQAGQECAVNVQGALVISNPLALREAARLGLGPALLADWLVEKDLQAGRLVNLFPDHEVTATQFDTGAWLLYPSRAHLPLRLRAVIDLLRAELAKRT